MSGHTSEKRWDDIAVGNKRYQGISRRASDSVNSLITTLNGVEEAYQQMQEIYTYAGGTDQLLADLLFTEDIAERGDSVANAAEVAKATDLVAAMSAAHQIYQAADNVAVTQSDRFSALRRMS